MCAECLKTAPDRLRCDGCINTHHYTALSCLATNLFGLSIQINSITIKSSHIFGKYESYVTTCAIRKISSVGFKEVNENEKETMHK